MQFDWHSFALLQKFFKEELTIDNLMGQWLKEILICIAL